MKKSAISGLISIAIIIGYGALVIHGIKNMQDWAWSGWALFPLAILCGVGAAVTGSYWEKEKEEGPKTPQK